MPVRPGSDKVSPSMLVCLPGYYFSAYIFFNRLFFSPAGSFHFHPVFIQVALLLCAAALFAFLLRKSAFDIRPDARTCAAVGLLLAAAVVLDGLGLGFAASAQLAIQFLACVLFGFGFVLYTLLWVRVYEALPFPVLLTAVAAAFVASSVVRALTYVDMYGRALWQVAFCAVMAVSLAMLHRAFRLEQREGRVAASARWQGTRSFFSTLKGPLVAVAAVAFGVGLTWGEEATVDYSPLFAVASAVLVGALSVLFGRWAHGNPKVRCAFFGAVFPLSTILLLASLLWEQLGEAGSIGIVFDVAYYLGISLFEVFTFAAIIVVSQNNGASASTAVLVKFIVYGAAFAAGKALSSFADGVPLFAVLTAVLLLYLAFNVVVLAVNQVVDAAHTAVPVQDAISERVGERFGLTPRERDVLSCLLEGRSYEGVGRALFISSSTVKTHVKHIYEKLGVKNRDELIDKVF